MTSVCPQVTATCLSPFIFNMDLNVPSLLWWVLILRSPPNESLQISSCVIVDMMVCMLMVLLLCSSVVGSHAAEALLVYSQREAQL